MTSNQNYINYLVNWIKNQVKKANKSGVIVGISGGIDSALVAVLAKKAFPNDSLGLVMKIKDMSKDLQDISKLVKKFDIQTREINLSNIYENFVDTLKLEDKMSLANLQPRLRMSTLYAIAQEKNYLVLGTDNLVEMYIGYFTKYGDGGVDLLPIVNLSKTQVYNLAKELGINEEILNKAPSAGLWENQKDEDEMKFSYKDFDQFLQDKSKLKKSVVDRIEYLHEISQHKRNKIPRPSKKLKDF
ncbi:NAD(+) synthase [Mesomycoplasma hyorhinis]|uniref:NH(3)-dependent NAD(+) synthetase n=2 Tax=Mesomycoplasma hyorhinis TaxID=2100 RepID=A0ABD6IDL6_MESHY|nr:NAD(+) synthase [Mesomycoplasma hyorhinis]ADM21966.1 NH(3)-dependent NAD(+) synthetase [Mesomycoplasma hyorhinis HUB-1]AEC46201.1 NH(3)-dependent NAD(+) synthetase [Mesomycoplasma hyorhinis MCLD]AEX14287.1 NH(3)-dependent NAD(+) synthetase [Mesomycoplasma hyorhinis GDL-1]AHA41297.1 NH(3)-dependent NAD(+) synthetase [Mesomycoplasma hyorhinis DBS 1050]MXR06318.1 NAD(+) synthase [Mesomycoplasma hyorhinis]